MIEETPDDAPAAWPVGFEHHAGALDVSAQVRLLASVRAVIEQAPLYVPAMPKTGKPMSVRMTNCGVLGWVTDRDNGYRYEPRHPVTGAPWPPIPEPIASLWQRFAPGAPEPEACLINWYEETAKLGLHRDEDEIDKTAPVVSISLGDAAWFRIGGLKRRDPTQRIKLLSGDVVVLGGAARLAYHGVDRILPGTSTVPKEVFPSIGRFNLTLRRVTE